MATYKNTFFKNDKKERKEYITTESKPMFYKNHYIYHRISSNIKDANIFDIVKNNECIGMYAGVNGAKNRIDSLDNNNVIQLSLF